MKNLLERFSCYLVGRGKKVSGHKILLESLFMLREKNNSGVKRKTVLNLALQRDLFTKTEDRLTRKTKSSSINKAQQKNTTFQKAQLANNFAQKHFTKNEHFINTKNPIDNLNIFNSHSTEKVNVFLTTAKDKIEITENLKKNKDNQASSKKNSFSINKANQSLMQTRKNNHNENKEKTKKITIIQKNTQLFSDEPIVAKPFVFEELVNKSVCQLSVDNVKPVLETRKIRKGRITYRVPKISCLRRQEGKAIALLIENATSRRKSELKRSSSHLLKPLVKENSSPASSSTKVREASSKISPKIESSFLPKTHTRMIDSTVDSMYNTTKDSLLTEKRNISNRYLSSEHNFFYQKKSKSYSIKHCLSEELFDSANEKGESIEKKKQLHQFALQNRANLHFRWW